MACDTFTFQQAEDLLRGKFVYLFGDSNTRGLYKDLIWLLEHGSLLPENMLKTKNEYSHACDVRLSNSRLHNGRDYKEVREYIKRAHVKFEFITRLYLPDFVETIKNLKQHPDVLILNSCVWDLTRWGLHGVSQYKNNVAATFCLLKSYIPNTRIIWLTTLPPTFTCHGGFLTKESEYVRNMLPWHILFANQYVSEQARMLNIDVLDLHYHFRFLMNNHTNDGIHWNSRMMRYATNLLLSHIALAWKQPLPGVFLLDGNFLLRSQIPTADNAVQTPQQTVIKPKNNAMARLKMNKGKRRKMKMKLWYSGLNYRNFF